MAAQRIFYLPLKENFIDQDGVTWTPTGSCSIATVSDGTNEITGLRLANQTSRLTSSKPLMTFSGNFVIKYYVYKTANYTYNDYFYKSDSNGTNRMYNVENSSGFGLYIGGSVHYLGGTNFVPLNKWTQIMWTFDGSTLKLYKDNVLAGSCSRSATSVYAPNVIGSDSANAHSTVGYFSDFSMWINTADVNLDYTYDEKTLEHSIKLPLNITDTYTTSPNKLIYHIRVRFEKKGNVVNYETTRILSVLRKILIINILYKYIRSLNF